MPGLRSAVVGHQRSTHSPNVIRASRGSVQTPRSRSASTWARYRFASALLLTQRARRRLGPVVAVADAAHLPVADAAIEQAVSIWLLHLVADRAAVMAEVARALRPGGRYLVSSARVGVPPTDDIDRLVFDMRNQLDPRWDNDRCTLARPAGDPVE